MLPENAARARVLILAEDHDLDSSAIVVPDPSALGAALRALVDAAGLDDDTVLLRVTEATADAVADALPGLLEQLPELAVAVLMGPLASETWRRHAAFQLHVTLVDAPHPPGGPGEAAERVRGALAGAAAMAG